MATRATHYRVPPTTCLWQFLEHTAQGYWRLRQCFKKFAQKLLRTNSEVRLLNQASRSRHICTTPHPQLLSLCLSAQHRTVVLVVSLRPRIYRLDACGPEAVPVRQRTTTATRGQNAEHAATANMNVWLQATRLWFIALARQLAKYM